MGPSRAPCHCGRRPSRPAALDAAALPSDCGLARAHDQATQAYAWDRGLAVVRNFLSATGERVINEFTAAATEFIKSFLEPLSDSELSQALTGLGRINASAQALGLQPQREIPVPATS